MVELTALLTTYNRASLLEQVLRSFTSQSLAADRYELVIIDDGSEDHTATVVNHFKDSLPIRYFFQPNAGLAAARNHGLAVSQAPVILFMDDDDTIEPATLAQHVEKHQSYPEPEVAVLGFTKLDHDIAQDPLMHFITEISGLLFSYRNVCENKFFGFDMFWGGRISCKRDFILTSGGFNPVFRFGCEDIELGYRLSQRGLKVLYNPKAVSTMIRKLTFESFCNRLRRQGNSQYIFSRLYAEPEVQVWCQMPMFYVEWPALSEVYVQTLDRAHALDHWARRCGELGLPLDQAILVETHDAYHKAFIVCKLFGIAEMRVAWQDPIDLGPRAKQFEDPTLLDQMRQEIAEMFDAFREQQSRQGELLGSVNRTAEASASLTPLSRLFKTRSKVVIPPYVKETAADYHINEFQQFASQVDIRGKSVLEIDSDYHLASARLFIANGARNVVATNIGDWRSEEPLPKGVSFKVCDVADVDLPANSVDVVYGIGILERIPDLVKVCQAIQRLLRPDGVAYLQGCPLWPGSLGHHVWYPPNNNENVEETFSIGEGRKTEPIKYSFADPKYNPIPNWAHLALKPEELEGLLAKQGVPQQDGAGIVRYVFNLDGVMVGSCSNFMAASQILDVLEEHFNITVERITSQEEENEFFVKAREQYSEEDLRTLGLKVWMRQKGYVAHASEPLTVPKVSVIIPFYNVDKYITECLASVVNQDYPNLEILLIDDASPDGSRQIAERFAAKDPRVKLITHEINLGLGPARNTGVKGATGAYLVFLDSDDFFSSPQAISTLVAEAESTGCRVVIGSCQCLLPDGRKTDFDRDFDRQYGGRPGEIVEGEAAYLGASFIPGGQYVPMRAWGTLIDRVLYDDFGLQFPAAEHEDLAHTPFLYYFAGRVLYIPDIVVTYRQRPDSISNIRWDTGMIQRYAGMWQETKANVKMFGLHQHLGDTAVKLAEHLVMKLRNNGLEPGATTAAIAVLEEILSEAGGELDEALFFSTMDSLRGILDLQKYNYNLFHRLTGKIPREIMIKYYRDRLAGTFVDHGAVPIAGVFAATSVPGSLVD